MEINNILNIIDPERRNRIYDCYLEEVMPIKFRYLDTLENTLLEEIRLLEKTYGIPLKFSVIGD